MDKNIKKFCKNPTLKEYKKFPKKIQSDILNFSFNCLYQKVGNQKKAKQILMTINQLKR